MIERLEKLRQAEIDYLWDAKWVACEDSKWIPPTELLILEMGIRKIAKQFNQAKAVEIQKDIDSTELSGELIKNLSILLKRKIEKRNLTKEELHNLHYFPHFMNINIGFNDTNDYWLNDAGEILAITLEFEQQLKYG